MGYRQYLYALDKEFVKKIQMCKTNEDWCQLVAAQGYKVREIGDEKYFAPRLLKGKFYELGKEAFLNLEQTCPQIFTTKELRDYYEDYGFNLLTQENFVQIIESYKEKIINYFSYLLDPEAPSHYYGSLPKITKEELWKRHIEEKLFGWQSKYYTDPVDLSLDRECITMSGLYEYAIFELVRLYKTFDWKNNDLVLVGS